MSNSKSTQNAKENLEKFSGLLIPIVISVITLLSSPSDSAKDNLIAAVVTFIVTGAVTIWVTRRYTQSGAYEPTPEKNSQDIYELCNRVKSDWIDGQLALLPDRIGQYQPKLCYRSDLVEWKSLKGLGGQRPSPQSVGEAFNDNHKKLLIVGAAGSGKTLAMLSLTDEIIRRSTTTDPTPIVPLYLSLSSWDGSLDTFEKWASKEVYKLYKADETKTAFWLDNPKGWHRTLLVLDDLNEVPEAYQASCVKAINDFVEQHSTVELMIACRRAEYEKIGVKLKLPEAVEIMPLDEAQIQEFLGKGKLAQNKIDTIVSNYAHWDELAKSLRMLAIMVEVYGDDTTSAIVDGNDVEKLLGKYLNKQLLYLDTMKQSDMWGDVRWSAEEVKTHLKALAERMNMPELWIERIQPDWLPKSRKRIYEIMVYIICFLAIFFPGFLSIGLVFGEGRPAVWLLGAPALATAMAGGVLLSREAHLPVRLRTIFMGILLELAITAMIIIFIGLKLGLMIGIPLGLAIFAIVFIMLKYDIGGATSQNDEFPWTIYPVERLGRSYLLSLSGLVGTGAIILIAGLVILVLDLDLPEVQLFLIPTLLPLGLAAGLHGTHVKEDNLRVQVNYGIRQSGLNALAVFVIFGVIAGVLGGVWMTLNRDLLSGILFAIVHGIFIGMTQAVLWGGFALVQHMVLRFHLSNSKTFPFQIERFLNVASRCTLMIRSGGYYAFYPPEIKEYFLKEQQV